MKKEELANRIVALLNDQGISFSSHQARLCAQHILLMLDWNLRVNLTRITDIDEILTKHLLDSVIPSRWLPGQGTLLDVGTGAGFPGIPVKVAHPELRVVLLEAQRKKVSFLKVVLANLHMSDISAVQATWESHSEWMPSAIEPEYDVITMRAVRFGPDQLAPLVRACLRPHGLLAWWVGPSLDNNDIESYNRALIRTGVEPTDCIAYHLPSASRPRRLCVWKRVG